MPLVLVGLVALLAASALALDAGVLWTARTQLQASVDASALAAAASLIDPVDPDGPGPLPAVTAEVRVPERIRFELDAIDPDFFGRVLDHLGDARLDDVGGSADVGRGDRDDRRADVGVFPCREIVE